MSERYPYFGYPFPSPKEEGEADASRPKEEKKNFEEVFDLSEYAVVTERVRKKFGKYEALRGVSLQVKAGSVFALLGPNGAGKTTLLRILTTLSNPDSGRVYVAGMDAVHVPEEVRRRIGLAGQYAAVDEHLTGRENLELVGRLYHLSRKESRTRAEEILQDFSLNFAENQPLKTYSGGMRRRLDLAVSLIGHPSVLFLDEPTTGLDPKSRHRLWKMIQKLSQAGTTVFLTTQQLDEADALADKIAIMDHGVIIAEGTPRQLKQSLHGDVLELRLKDQSQAEKALTQIRRFASDESRIELHTERMLLPVENGAKTLILVVQELLRAGFEIESVALRQPNLDEVFLALTGEHAESAPPHQSVPKASGWAA
ncbi:MAG TPA: ATP-binding cassette domain-containing protein [Candidatus Paceibacterota bacterium]|nr:ATP-binding cassette domain-containing protein [Candidatus Paceibacterota bacterium]